MKIRLLHILLLIACVSYGQVPTNGLIAEYQFNSATPLVDNIDGNNLNVAGNPFIAIADRFGNANDAAQMNVEGAAYRSNIDITSSTNPLLEEVSYSFWLKTNVNDGNRRTILDDSGRALEGFSGDQSGYFIFLRNGKIGATARLVYTESAGGSDQIASISINQNDVSVIADNNWHHIVISFSNTISANVGTASINVSIDNAPISTYSQGYALFTGSLSNSLDRTGEVTLNDNKLRNIANTNKYQGGLDDILVYDRVLTANDIDAIYTATSPTICTVAIPDVNFKAALVADIAINTNGNTEIECSEASAFTGILDVNTMNIADLTGVEAFTAITTLRAGFNQLTSIDVSANTSLEEIDVKSNDLTVLDVSANINLKELVLISNDISSLDLSLNTSLEQLVASFNDLTTLDVSANTSLYLLFANNNQLTSLNTANGNNTNFTLFRANGNPNLTCIQIDAGFTPPSGWMKDPAASYSDNCGAVCTVNIPDANFKAALVGNAAINTNGNTEIECSEASAFTGAIDVGFTIVSDLTGIEAFTALTVLRFPECNVSTLDVSNNIMLTELTATANQLTSIDVTNNTALNILRLNGNQLTSIDVSNNVALDILWLAGNSITDLDLTANTNLSQVLTQNNQLTSLNIANGNNGAVTFFNASGNAGLSCIQVDAGFTPPAGWIKDAGASYSDNCGAVCTVNIPDANFKAALVANTAINTNGNTEIECSEAISFTGAMPVQGNSIVDLTGLEAFTSLTGLNASNNPLTLVDVSANTALQSLELVLCQLTALDVSNNTSLTLLRCNLNALTNLNVANGNNGSISTFDATNNNNLTCIQIDAGFTPPAGWMKDPAASYSDNCGADTTAPVANCQNVTIQIDANGTTSIVPTQIDNGSTDDVAIGSFSVTPSGFNCSDLGANTVTFTVTDTSGNTDTCTATVTIIDTIAPVITSCPADATVTVNVGVLYTMPDFVGQGDATATDNCTATLTQNPAAGTQLAAGNTTVTITASDASGNTDTCTVIITVQELDSTPPVANCQNITAQLDASGNVTITAAQIDNGSTDDVGVDSIALDTTSFDCSNLGSNTVTLTVADAAGNTATCTATVNVEDNVAPTITCPVNSTVMVNQGDLYTLPDYITNGDVTVTDNCPSVTTTQVPAPGTMIVAGVQTVTFTADDLVGNVASCSFELTVDETLSTKDLSLQNTVSIYPNPAASFITIESSLPLTQIEVYNIHGQKVLVTNAMEQLNVSNLSSGVYFITIYSDTASVTKKFIRK